MTLREALRADGPQTLSDALRTASKHWEARPGHRTMVTGCGACVDVLGASTGASTLGVSDAVSLLAALRRGRSPKSVATYYGAFRRMLDLVGVSTKAWPNAPTPPRKTRDPMGNADADALHAWLVGKGWTDTADLLVFMRGTGLRVGVEALTVAHLTHIEGAEGDGYDVLQIVGKGGHEREIPVVRLDTVALLRDPVRMSAMQSVGYATHLSRWNKGVEACGINSRLATPHSVRHGYASEVYRKSGGNLVMTQELLGHADPRTTARYISVDITEKAGALSAT